MTKPYVVRDTYFKKAKADGLRARSAFKLDEIQSKFGVVKPGQTVADLGAAPGSWAQRLCGWVGAGGTVVAVDLQEIVPLADNVVIYKADITDMPLMETLFFERVDGVVADLAPKTSGVKDADAYHSAELNHAVLDFCERFLKKGGYVVTKIFQGEDLGGVVTHARRLFGQVKCFKPRACRDASRETYIVGTGFIG